MCINKGNVMTLNKLFAFIFQTSLELNTTAHSDAYRTDTYIRDKITEELGEMADEIAIQKNNFLNIQPGKDGLAGETVDTFISAVDLYSTFHKTLSQQALADTLVNAINDSLGVKFTTVAELLDYAFTAYDNRLDKDAAFMRLISLSGNIALNFNIEKGLSYKLPQPGKLESLIVEFIAFSLFYFELISDNHSEQTADQLFELTFNKMNKWRKTRGLKEIDKSVVLAN